MSTYPSAARFFDRQARDYDRRSARGAWSLLRTREARAVLGLVGAADGATVLDLGCGAGFYSNLLRSRGARVYGVDASAKMIRVLRGRGIAGRRADAGTVRLGRKFDVILAAGLVEFLDDEHSLFETARRHAHADSRLVLLAPRNGLPGRLYELCHRWMGCPARARAPESLRAAAEGRGWRLDGVAGAGPLAVALRFSPSAGGAGD